MRKSQPGTSTEALNEFADVVFLSDKSGLPFEVRRLFRRKRLSHRLLPLEAYHAVHRRPDLVGTVIIDAEGADRELDQRFGRILEILERDNLGVILLTQRVRRPVRSFSLVPSESSFSMTSKLKSISVDALWARISVNLADRKEQDSGITIKPAASRSAIEKTHGTALVRDLQASTPLMDSLTEQLRLAGLVQRDFLPSQLPNCDEAQFVASFIPAEWVSGDIYDVARIDEQHIGFYIADAVGHSMPAALLTIFIKHSLAMRETLDNSYRIFSPLEVVANLNARMVGQKLSGYQFATCCYCLFNIRTRQLTFARAGHPYPILFREGQPLQQLETRGALLGVFDNAEFAQRAIQLESGDRLLLYSDGAESLIGQLVDSEGFHFSEDLVALKDAPITEIVDTLTEIANNREISHSEVDDFTLVGLQVP
ncbi:MAG: PP2C family protein-serine/threonine phosphatase [Planctomycetota bacterium]|jgi:sigma-B regulation protein RsbU (phosphoserine phosphatase)